MYYKTYCPPPPTLTGEEYEVSARVLLGFQAVAIFGVKAITSSIKQAVVDTPYYIDKARRDGEEIGLPLTLEHMSDATMETAHKQPKQGNKHSIQWWKRWASRYNRISEMCSHSAFPKSNI